MPLRITAPVPLEDVLALYARDILLKPTAFRAAVLQHARSESIGFYDGEGLVAAVMLYPAPPERPGEDLRELAFACLPRAARHLTGIVHYARLTRAHLAHDPSLRIRATVRKGHFPGQRLARLIGLKAAGEQGAFERWEWTASEGRHEQVRRGRQNPVHRRRDRGAQAGARAAG